MCCFFYRVSRCAVAHSEGTRRSRRTQQWGCLEWAQHGCRRSERCRSTPLRSYTKPLLAADCDNRRRYCECCAASNCDKTFVLPIPSSSCRHSYCHGGGREQHCSGAGGVNIHSGEFTDRTVLDITFSLHLFSEFNLYIFGVHSSHSLSFYITLYICGHSVRGSRSARAAGLQA